MSRHPARRSVCVCLVLLCAGAGSGQPARAEVGWDASIPAVGAPDYALGFVAALNIVVWQFGTRPLTLPRVKGALPLDDELRSPLRLRSREQRDLAATVSNGFWHASELVPVVDSLIVALLVEQDPELAWNLSFINATAIGLTGALSSVLARTVGRARPLYDDCRRDPGYAGMCINDQEVMSFWSGHTAMAFTGAGLTCSHHAHLDLYGSRAGDAAVCLGAIALAATTGYLRVAADRHYTSDVVAGALGGFLIGFGLPWLLHYRHRGDPTEETPALRSFVAPVGDGDQAGLMWTGDFR